MKKVRKQPQTSQGTVADPPPIDDLQERIRRRAYELWEQGGYEHGRDHEHWVRAEQELAAVQGKTSSF